MARKLLNMPCDIFRMCVHGSACSCCGRLQNVEQEQREIARRKELAELMMDEMSFTDFVAEMRKLDAKKESRGKHRKKTRGR